jgi:hypothetical protein
MAEARVPNVSPAIGKFSVGAAEAADETIGCPLLIDAGDSVGLPPFFLEKPTHRKKLR